MNQQAVHKITTLATNKPVVQPVNRMARSHRRQGTGPPLVGTLPRYPNSPCGHHSMAAYSLPKPADIVSASVSIRHSSSGS